MNKKTSYEDLIEEALLNASADRERAVEAFEKTKQIYDVDFTDKETMEETMSALMLLGQSIPKLLELANKSNEQIIKLAQLREKEESRKPKEDSDSKAPFDMDAIRQIYEKSEKQPV